jgi:hypothetical protein
MGRRRSSGTIPVSLVERYDAGLARGVIVLDRCVEVLALVGDVAANVRDVVSDLGGMIIRHGFLPIVGTCATRV